MREETDGSEEGRYYDSRHERQPGERGRALLFILFLVVLAIVLKGMGWCIGGVCEVGTDMLLP